MIFRTNKNENYVVIHKGFLNDLELSWQAKGMLTYMLSLPNDWRFNIKDLANRSKNGRDATRRIVDELVAAGYIVKQQSREQGKFGNVDFDVFESKQIAPCTENQETVAPCTEKPFTEKPFTDNPFPENPSLLSNKELSNKQLSNKQVKQQQQQSDGGWYRSFYQSIGKIPTPIQIQEIDALISQNGIEEEAICLLLEKVASADRPWGLFMKISGDWIKLGIKTKEQALQDFEMHKRRAAANDTNRKPAEGDIRPNSNADTRKERGWSELLPRGSFRA